MNQNGNTDSSELHKAEAEPKNDTEQIVNQEWKDLAENKTDKNIAELKAKYDELEDQYKRLWADQQNMMNRFNREKQEISKYAATSTLEAILPALDNFDFAKKSFNEKTQHDEFIKSIEMLQSQLLMCLKAVGLEEVDTSGTFNPELHEAVSKISDPSKPEASVVEVLKKGFKVKDKVLRVATVVVSTKE